MIPIAVIGILVAVTLGASPFVAMPIVILVGGLAAKVMPYYFPPDD